MIHAKEHPDFITVTCLEWKHLLANDSVKEIIIDSLRFLVKQNKISVYAFCLMSNHIHLIWQMLGDHRRANVQRDFLKYTGQQILRKLEERESPLLSELRVDAKDRKISSVGKKCIKYPIIFGPRLFFRSWITFIGIRWKPTV